MIAYVMGDWFLEKINILIRWIQAFIALIRLRRLFGLLFAKLCYIPVKLASIELWRFLSLILKRAISIVRNVLRIFLMVLPIPLLEFLYVFHFLRSFLTIVNFFKVANKNLVEITKFLLACIKVSLAVLMSILIVVAVVQGVAPLAFIGYPLLKTLFLCYTFSKFIINWLTLAYSAYRIKKADNAAEHAEHDWLKQQYAKNLQKHREILLVGIPITVLSLLLTFVGAGLGPVGFPIVIALLCGLLLFDIVKATYYFFIDNKVAEPKIGELAVKNSLIDYSYKDYYYRKCRIARLTGDDIHGDRIYLLKEIIVKIIQLDLRIKADTYFKVGRFFSEKEKIRQKREGLIQEAATLLFRSRERNLDLLVAVFASFDKENENIKSNNSLRPLPQIKDIEEELSRLRTRLESLQKGECLNETELLWDMMPGKHKPACRLESTKKPKRPHGFFKSTFRKMADCEDIQRAVRAFSEEVAPQETYYEVWFYNDQGKKDQTNPMTAIINNKLLDFKR